MRKIAILHADETPTACLDITTIENLYMNCFSEINIAIEFFDVKNHHYPSNADKSIDAYLITGSKFCV
jgi:hypothetical protein